MKYKAKPTRKCSLIKSTVKNVGVAHLHMNLHTHTHLRSYTSAHTQRQLTVKEVCTELERWVHSKCQIDKFGWMECSEDTFVWPSLDEKESEKGDRVSMVYRNLC